MCILGQLSCFEGTPNYVETLILGYAFSITRQKMQALGFSDSGCPLVTQKSTHDDVVYDVCSLLCVDGPGHLRFGV